MWGLWGPGNEPILDNVDIKSCDMATANPPIDPGEEGLLRRLIWEIQTLRRQLTGVLSAVSGGLSARLGQAVVAALSLALIAAAIVCQTAPWFADRTLLLSVPVAVTFFAGVLGLRLARVWRSAR